GNNDISEKKIGFIKKFLVPVYSPISLMLLGAAFLSLFNEGRFDFYFIIVLYCVNYFAQRWQEFKADKAIKHLRDKLSFDVLTLRDGVWRPINAKLLVSGDRIKLGLGSMIPADGVILSSRNLAINEAALTGESLPKEKKASDKIYSGSFIVTGDLEAEIKATGRKTYFGKTIFSIEPATQKSMLERDIFFIARFLTIISIAAVFILTVVFVYRGFPISRLIVLDLSLVIAGIPIALPAVMAVILSVGASGLAKKMVVVRRLSALQDLANVNLLLTDKTGTLTKNQIKIVNIISYQEDLNEDDISELAGYAASKDDPSAIDAAIFKRLEEAGRSVDGADIINFAPYDSDRKRTTAYIQKGEEKILVSLGAPQIIRGFDGFNSEETESKFYNDIRQAAADGYRVLALAVKKGEMEEKNMKIAGLIFMADPLEENSKETLRFIKANGIGVKMLTGDNKIIAERIAGELGLSGKIISENEIKTFFERNNWKKEFDDIAGFAEILPKDKYEIVKSAKDNYTVAVTGDGVNDFSALKIANVGIAAAGAVSALKSTADIVLLEKGISVIKDAILESRKIFVRLYNYSVYRISESFRVIITILILGLWYGFYPLVPLQLIVLALLNDIPIISLAVDRVKISAKPSEIKIKERFALSLLFGSVGVLNSILFFLLLTKIYHPSLSYLQTMFFLKLTVSGHALIFVAHTKEKWFRFLPSKEVITATVATQAAATVLSVSGLLMPEKISLRAAAFVWVWALFWMQISELMKYVQAKTIKYFDLKTKDAAR
ncbi:MAG: plasma-membrane proton-efflux P-type ATPase, partial [Patescibacteria group bacterium]|nr:plasma-membrane proton-efflux P-type ATPase [Patescibacteria group bacterium]